MHEVFFGVPLSSGDVLCSEDVVECVFMVQFKLHFLSRSCLLLAEEKAQQWLALQCCNILKATQSSSHDSFYYVIHICMTFSWQWKKKKKKQYRGNNRRNYSLQYCKNGCFQNNSFSKNKQLFFPVILLKRNSNVILKLYMLTVYVFGKGINV